MKKHRTLEQLKQQYSHYQKIYEQANAEGQSYIRLQLCKLERQIQGLQPPKYELHRQKSNFG